MRTIWTLAVFLGAAYAAGPPGNCLLWMVWEKIADRCDLSPGEQAKLSKWVGSLERVLYVFGVMTAHYEVIAGWLVMKAFFEWTSDHEVTRSKSPETTSEERRRLYNEFIIGNILSLLIGLGVGVIAHWLAELGQSAGPGH